MNWRSIVAAGLGSIIGSLLAIFATPPFQHYFWKRQRRAELKLRTIETITILTAQFIQQWIAADRAKQRYRPSVEWHENFSAAEAVVKSLFSSDTYRIFKNLEERIEPSLGAIDDSHPSVNAFIEARDAAVRALYNEVV